MRLLTSSSAFFWGLQFAFLNPALALILVSRYEASPFQVGWILALYSASGFVASLLIPVIADRRRDYLRPMLACGILTLLLAAVLMTTFHLSIAVAALATLGGPASVGGALLFAHLQHVGSSPEEVVRTRAFISIAWVGGPPLASLLVSTAGNDAILVALGCVAVCNSLGTARMISRDGREEHHLDGPLETTQRMKMSKAGFCATLIAFILLLATNGASISVMGLYVAQTLRLDLIWSGVALAVAAGLEVPAMLVISRLSARCSSLALIGSGCAAGAIYYLGMAIARGPIELTLLQVLKGWYFATVAGIGLTLFQNLIPRPGLASATFTNLQRIGSIASGAIIALTAATPLGYRGTFAACAGLTLFALPLTALAARQVKRHD